ncbi:MAG: hypothetical protein IIU14_04880 [Ruminococcus sp.]|nr:hypothetical protein [Ruminococcus sp.]
MSRKKTKKHNLHTKKPKKKSMKPLIAAICAAVVVIGGIVAAYLIWQNTSLEATDFVGKEWVSVEARDASNDEVDIFEVYNVKYNNYNGRLGLNGDGSFNFWMSPGDESDGTHTGKYSYDREKQRLNMEFDSGDKMTCKIKRKADNTIERIEVPYNGYTVYFIINKY